MCQVLLPLRRTEDQGCRRNTRLGCQRHHYLC
ncbi:hypothetical protein PRIPAC_85254 [Pristionchus pacificus]|uniref:Uncharacterized protein n=1 Tax=Pristionchus pacificus TaxID=54126 RepID=A0A2A6BMI5_PRIPA|nr:hypothetical protein PRIPAC_85254 [Pristionchus pacificus]|eukprot:PDM67119.1 hypothetical protein PRIPAC_48536 [Pristionchus pacificus]